MKSLSTPAKETSTKEPNHLRILRISTLIMTLIMIIGFVIIVTLLSIAINKNIKTQSLLKIEPKVVLNENEVLNAVTYLPDYTILVLTKNKDVCEKGHKIRKRK